MKTSSRAKMQVNSLAPKKRKKIKLDELVAAIKPDNIHGEITWGNPAGKEVW